MFNKIFAAVASIAMVASPVNARIEDGTRPLMQLLDDNGIPVTINDTECNDGEYLGIYIHRGLARKMVLCPGASVEPIDHSVVRHEAWHAIQHCVNTARGTSTATPVNDDATKLLSDIKDHLTEDYIANVKANYPAEQWLLELEAYMAMEIFTADEISEMFLQACTFKA